MWKFLTHTQDIRLQDVLKKCKIIHCAQIGFTEEHRTTHHIITLKSLISKHVSSVNGENLENFYKCLFDNNDKRAIASQEKIQIPIELSESRTVQLDEVTCSKELEIVLKKLKKGKGPGFDRISNEMTKASFVF